MTPPTAQKRAKGQTNRLIAVAMTKPPRSGITVNQVGELVSQQQARNLSFTLAEHHRPTKFLTRDRDTKLTAGFRRSVRAEGVRIIRTPIRSPRPNAFAERFIGTVRRECLDRMLVFDHRQLERILAEFVGHYNDHRPYRSLVQRALLDARRSYYFP